MIARLAKKISFFFIKKKVILECDEEIYSYGLELLLASIINLVAVFTIAILFDKVFETLIYLVAFLPLRIICGGYHADTHLRCILVLVVTYLLVLILIAYTPESFRKIIALISIFFSLFSVFLLSPMESSNNPMTKEQKIKLKFKSRIAILFYFIVVAVLILINDCIALILAFGTLSVGLSLVANGIKELIKINITKNIKIK